MTPSAAPPVPSPSALRAAGTDAGLDVVEITTAEPFVEVRRTLGGPAPPETARAVAASRARLEHDSAEWQRRRDHLADADRQLHARVAAL